jgi:hypothetical protein
MDPDLGSPKTCGSGSPTKKLGAGTPGPSYPRSVDRRGTKWRQQRVLGVNLKQAKVGIDTCKYGLVLDTDLISEPPPDVCIQNVGICVARGAGSDS